MPQDLHHPPGSPPGRGIERESVRPSPGGGTLADGSAETLPPPQPPNVPSGALTGLDATLPPPSAPQPDAGQSGAGTAACLQETLPPPSAQAGAATKPLGPVTPSDKIAQRPAGSLEETLAPPSTQAHEAAADTGGPRPHPTYAPAASTGLINGPKIPGYEVLLGAGPRRHGRRLQGPAGRAQPPGRPQDDPVRAPTPAAHDVARFRRRPRPSPSCSTPTSSRSTRSASTTAGPTSRWNSSTAARSTRSWTATRCPRRRRARLVRDAGPGHGLRPPPASSTAT